MAGPASRTFKSYPTKIEMKPGETKEFTLDTDLDLSREVDDKPVYNTSRLRVWKPGNIELFDPIDARMDVENDRMEGRVRVTIELADNVERGSWYGELEFFNADDPPTLIDHSETFNFEILPSI